MMGNNQDFRPACRRGREWISLRLDGELSELERALLRAHLVRCGGCRTFARDIDGATHALRAAPLERLSRPIAIPRRSVLSGGLRRVGAFAAAASVAAVVAMTGLTQANQSSQRLGVPANPLPASSDHMDRLRPLRRAQLKTAALLLSQGTRGQERALF
jgi:hypothetical protein